MSLEKLGPYRFKGVLGRGGMGTVYRGKHEETGEYHAVKVLAPTFADDDHFRGRFESEIKALLKLNHPNIVQLISYGQEDGLLFFSMELVEGNSLFQMQRKGHRFDWRQVLSIARDVCHGLRHAHDRGIIHRDLKPGNLLMTERPDDDPRRTIDGMVKITDFGIAKSFGSSQNTGTNVLGTMDFMSPEQAKGEPVTFRSDLYSLGTVLFTLLSGKPPFTANSVEESLRNLTRVPPPYVSNVVPDVPKELERLIRQLMAKKPADRVPTALALLHRIEEVEDHLRSHAEAKTTERDIETVAGDTFDVASPAAAGLTELGTGKAIRKTTDPSRRAGRQTAEYTDQDLDEIKLAPRSSRTSEKTTESSTTDRAHNYFNTVNDHVRKQHDDTLVHYDSQHERGKTPLIIALLVVLGLAAFGVYHALKPPSAEALYANIIANESHPDRVLDEINEFLTHFPDEQRSLKVMELEGVGRAIRLYEALTRKLSVRASLPGQNRLRFIEQQFLDLVQLAEDDSTMANSKMAAFVNLYSNDSNLDERDALCVEAARNFRVKIRADARSRVMSNITQIRNAMEKAASLEDPADAAQIYDSIIELYGNVMWGNEKESPEGSALVSNARKMLERKLSEVRRNLLLREVTPPTP